MIMKNNKTGKKMTPKERKQFLIDRERMRLESIEFKAKYYSDHKACPKCGSIRHSSTYIGIMLDMSKMDEYKDINDIKCSDCGWCCITHDLVPVNDKIKEI